MRITKEMIEAFLVESEKEFRYTTEQNIVTIDIIYFFKGNLLFDIGVNNLYRF